MEPTSHLRERGLQAQGMQNQPSINLYKFLNFPLAKWIFSLVGHLNFSFLHQNVKCKNQESLH